MDLFGDSLPETPAKDDDESAVKTVDMNAATGETSPTTLSDFEHPASQSFILGHSVQENQLLSYLQSGRIPHALVFNGPPGIGKATMAYRFARALLNLNENPAPDTLDMERDHSVFRRVVSGGHPDFKRVERHYDDQKNRLALSVDVAEIRSIAPFVRMTSSAGGWRVVVVDDADTMTRSAQNAILKILEEPPAKTALILVTHRLGAMVATIRSRARLINFAPLDQNTILDLLSRRYPEIAAADRETLAAMGQGSFGKACAVHANGGLDILTNIKSVLADGDTPDWPVIHAMAEDMSRAGNQEGYQQFCEIMLSLVSEIIRAKVKGHSSSLLLGTGLDSLCSGSSLEHWLEICDNLQNVFQQTDASNLDKRIAVISGFKELAA